MERIWNLFMYAIKKQNKFEGRACRMEAISFYIIDMILMLIMIPISMGFLFAGAAASEGSSGGIGYVLMGIGGLLMLALLIIQLILLVPGIGVACRRLHDINLSGWLQVLNYIPYIGGFCGLVLAVLYFFVPGTEGDNNYGPISENY